MTQPNCKSGRLVRHKTGLQIRLVRQETYTIGLAETRPKKFALTAEVLLARMLDDGAINY